MKVTSVKTKIMSSRRVCSVDGVIVPNSESLEQVENIRHMDAESDAVGFVEAEVSHRPAEGAKVRGFERIWERESAMSAEVKMGMFEGIVELSFYRAVDHGF